MLTDRIKFKRVQEKIQSWKTKERLRINLTNRHQKNLDEEQKWVEQLKAPIDLLAFFSFNFLLDRIGVRNYSLLLPRIHAGLYKFIRVKWKPSPSFGYCLI